MTKSIHTTNRSQAGFTLVELAVVMIIIAFAAGFGWLMAVSGLPREIAAWIGAFSNNPLVILMLINGLLLIVGCFMEAIAAMIILIPVLIPIVQAAGVDLVHFGLVIVFNLMLGLLTPPLAAMNSFADVLAAFRIGENSLLASLFSPRVTRILFAATKADHLHHTNHDRLEAILRLLVRRAHHRAQAAGAPSDSLALAAIRATREVMAREKGIELPCVAGIPIAGEMLDGKAFDGETEAAIFPGDLPDNVETIFRGEAMPLQFLRFRPPSPAARKAEGGKGEGGFPQIRLDRARHLLETSDLPLKTVAYRAGFRSVRCMRIQFSERLGLTPAQYRHQFG